MFRYQIVDDSYNRRHYAMLIGRVFRASPVELRRRPALAHVALWRH